MVKINNIKCFPFNQENIFLFGYARTALYEGLGFLGIGKGDSILVPDYICGAALSPLRHSGIKTCYYALDNNLNPDWKNLRRIIDKNIKGLLIVNYFGFPNALQQAREFCQEYGIYLLEDNAHGYLSLNGRLPLGSYGDISIFSFRKTLPIPNGAALLVNNDRFKPDVLKNRKYGRIKPGLARFIVKSFLKSLKGAFAFRNYGAFMRNLREIAEGRERKEEFNLKEYFIDFHPLSRFLINRIDLNKDCLQRRTAYKQWLHFFSQKNNFGAVPLFPELKDGVVPYVFPVSVEKREDFMIEMYRMGIESFPWPTLPIDSKENYFSRRIACLPLIPAQTIHHRKRIWKKK